MSFSLSVLLGCIEEFYREEAGKDLAEELKDNMAAIQEHMKKERIERIEQRLAQFDKQKETKNPTVEKSDTCI